MRIDVDRTRCTGIGMCEAYAPDVFEVDDDGELVLRATELSNDDVATVEVAVRACPTSALSLEEAEQ